MPNGARGDPGDEEFSGFPPLMKQRHRSLRGLFRWQEGPPPLFPVRCTGAGMWLHRVTTVFLVGSEAPVPAPPEGDLDWQLCGVLRAGKRVHFYWKRCIKTHSL